MQMRLPQEVLEWVDSNRGSLSRQAFMITVMCEIMNMNNTEHFNTKELIDDIRNSAKDVSGVSKTSE